jgi:outer membrane lipoprotein SlyB
MKRFTMALSVLAVMALAACSTADKNADTTYKADKAFSKASHK